MADPRRFFLCRTPLQALIVMRIQALSPGRDTIVYQPTSASPKHAHYARRLGGERVVALPFATPFASHLAAELAAAARVPRAVWRTPYDELFVSSIGTLAFAMMAGRHPRAAVKTFDDGTFNLRRSHFFDWVDRPLPRHHRLVRALLRARTSREIVDSSAAHYTIFDPALALFPAERVVALALFDAPDASGDRPSLTVVLGAPIHLLNPRRAGDYAELVTSLRPDLYIPHPAETTRPPVETPMAGDPELRRALEECVAEEIVALLVRRGHRVRLHGLASTALLNLAGIAEVTNHHIDPPAADLALLFERAGIPSRVLAA